MTAIRGGHVKKLVSWWGGHAIFKCCFPNPTSPPSLIKNERSLSTPSPIHCYLLFVVNQDFGRLRQLQNREIKSACGKLSPGIAKINTREIQLRHFLVRIRQSANIQRLMWFCVVSWSLNKKQRLKRLIYLVKSRRWQTIAGLLDSLCGFIRNIISVDDVPPQRSDWLWLLFFKPIRLRWK